MPPKVPPALKLFHPIVRKWFREALGEPSLPQQRGWPTIAKGEHTLILAPTGTGKTLTAFLWELNALIVEGTRAPLANAVHILYISPLKALNNDIQRNLERPLEELRQRFADAGETFPEIRVAVRTGDTPSSARARMIRKSPHILITTPESLHIMLTTVRGRGMFSGVRAVIVDEIHAVAGTKRGAHLALTLERLERLCEQAPQRIGLSATQKPLEEIARFLVGTSRQCSIVDCGLVKQIELEVESPVDDLAHVGGTVWPQITAQVLRHVRASRTTIVFVNNRGQAEKMAARLNALAGEEIALPYHGSLSRERRFTLERALKAGSLRALVSTSALELGIDIGSVDLVIQLQSPKRVATGLQRVGRAGHSLSAVSRGLFVPTFRDDALEMLAVVRGMRDGDVEPTRVVQNALDVLAQVVVAAVSIDDDWTSASLFEAVKRAYPYHALGRAAFDEVLEMLSGKYPSDVVAELDARIVWDRSTDRLSAPRGSRMVAVISGGTIPDRGYYTVNLPDRTRLGELDEEFVHETRLGDVFQLGSSTWRVQVIEHDRVIVVPAPGAPARMPFWHGEFAARSVHLASRVGQLRRELTRAQSPADIEAIRQQYASDEPTIRTLVEYIHEQRSATRIVPDDRALLIEQFRDETGAVRVVLHAPFGGRVNAPWGMALAQRVRDWMGRQDQDLVSRRTTVDVQVQTTDDGILLRLPNLARPLPDGVLRDLEYPEAERLVLEDVGTSSLFGARFRTNAARALLLPRSSARRRMPLWLQRLKAKDLLEVVREHPSFPILVETYRDVLQDAFDMPSLSRVLGDLATGAITMRPIVTEVPSPFAASLQFGFVMDWMYADDTPRAEQRAALLSLDRALLDELMGGGGADESTLAVLDELLARRRGTAPGRRARSADELTLLLDRAGDLTAGELQERVASEDEGRRGQPLEEALDAGRAFAIPVPAAQGAEWRVILAESFPRYVAAFGVDAMARVRSGTGLSERDASDIVPAALRVPSLTEGAARREILSRWIALAGVFTIDDVRQRYDFGEEWITTRLDEWTRAGRLVRGAFGGSSSPPRWCLRRLLEQARRRELAIARKQIEAVEMPAFVHFLQRWQHLHPDTRLSGADGTSDVVRQLYGVARPAERWERDYLAPRVEHYDDDAITRLSSSGEMVWVGAGSGASEDGVVDALTSLRFVRRGTGRAWLVPAKNAAPSAEAQRVLDVLASEGASFFDDMKTATGLGTRPLRDALRELVAAGQVTCDSAESMRAVIRWRPLVTPRVRNQPDPTRWLPADFVAQRPVVQRRPNLRRLPRWKRPDKDGAEPDSWPGRWSLVGSARILGPEQDESALAEQVARQWLARYGVVSRDWWRRERPAVSWRAVYRELKRLEFRGDVRRGYFVRGLAGAQFALPDAVNQLRESIAPDSPVIVMAASDPANAYALPPAPGGAVEDRDPLTRRRSRGTVYATRGGVVLLVVESRGRRITVRPDATAGEITEAARAVIPYLTRAAGTRHDPIVETIDGASALAGAHTAAFVAAGFRVVSGGLRYYAGLAG